MFRGLQKTAKVFTWNFQDIHEGVVIPTSNDESVASLCNLCHLLKNFDILESKQSIGSIYHKLRDLLIFLLSNDIIKALLTCALKRWNDQISQIDSNGA